MGKRVDFSARSVITPDPNIELDQLGVPIKIALNLTFPEIANKFNIDILKEYILNGPNKWPGAKSIEKKNGKKYSIKTSNKYDLKLELGDKVNRHIKVATADDEFNKALYEEIRLEEEAFNEWVRENNKRIREKNRK